MSFFRSVDDGPRSLLSGRKSLLFIILLAVGAMGPELAIGLTVSDSYRFNLLWPEQFGELFRSGHLYPRWLPRSWESMGSPVFYFYPPLFFWVAALVDTGTAGVLPPERFVPVASLILLAASGIAMRAWLKGHVDERRATLGAIAYMLAPYHLYDLYARGALAEASAYAFVPLIMLAVARLAKDRPRYVPILALSYGALLFSHLPSALLVSLFLVPPYVVFLALQSERPARFIMLAMAGGLLGIALAAIYLLPAAALLSYASPAALSGSFYQPESWFFWNLRVGPVGAPRMFLIIPLSLAALLFAGGTALAAWTEKSRGEALFWAVLTILLVFLIAGLAPFVWKLPGLSFVQFPWRALLLVEFTAVTMLSIRAPSLRNPAIAGGALLLVFAFAVLFMMAGHTIGRTLDGQARTATEIRSKYREAPEYLPAGIRIVQGKGPDDVRIDLPKLPIASAADPRAKIAALDARDGGMTIKVDSPASTRLFLHRFNFPHWRAVNAAGMVLPIEPMPGQPIVSLPVPAGHSLVRLIPGSAPYEDLGRALTALALLSLAVFAALNRPTRRAELERI